MKSLLYFRKRDKKLKIHWKKKAGVGVGMGVGDGLGEFHHCSLENQSDTFAPVY